jgi:hypothetical protein
MSCDNACRLPAVGRADRRVNSQQQKHFNTLIKNDIFNQLRFLDNISLVSG